MVAQDTVILTLPSCCCLMQMNRRVGSQLILYTIQRCAALWVHCVFL